MQFINIKRRKDAKNTHYRMYKSGKRWIFASMVVAGLLGGSALAGED